MKQLFLCCTMALLCLCVPSSVRAQIYCWGEAPVPVDTVNWTQISDLPTVFISINTDSLASWNTNYNNSKKTETYFPAHIVIVDSTKNSDIPILTMNEYCGIRLRGNSTSQQTRNLSVSNLIRRRNFLAAILPMPRVGYCLPMYSTRP